MWVYFKMSQGCQPSILIKRLDKFLKSWLNKLAIMPAFIHERNIYFI